LELLQLELHRSSCSLLEPSKKPCGTCTWPTNQQEPLDELP